MARRRRDTSADAIERLIREGRGQGVGRDYVPWILVQDVPSEGFATRVAGWTTGREHHLLSRLELSYFYVLDWAQGVLDIREQYPLLPVDDTVAIAESLGIKHPTKPGTKKLVVMTTDVLVTQAKNGKCVDVARTVKQSAGNHGLSSARAIEKLEIERRYWAEHKTDWGIVTEREIPQTVVANIKWVHRCREISALTSLTHDTVRKVRRYLEARLGKTGEALAVLTDACDDDLGLEPGVALLAVRNLIASFVWRVDFTTEISPSLPLRVLETAAARKVRAAGGGA
jgi:hypothetical protein